ncbi:tRNA adenylyltransferase [Candidatus Uabimicrobium amorphum]|uniref:tRNA adenylyltransferase n=2 Tax=Uabimicrobium amorphum TaxID=2596890 RepID=A0A5S9F7D5_UABAM|nr:tRNA adenylyltransferase [Candidatus Uabimicrobium amorphum]
MMYVEGEAQYFTAKMKAARQINIDERQSQLPSNTEIRHEILRQANLYEGEKRIENLKTMRLYALSLMRQLQDFHPKLIGSTLTGHIRKNSDIDLHLFTRNVSLITQILDQENLVYEVERKRVVKYNVERIFTHIHLHGLFEVEMSIYTLDYLKYRFKCSITGEFMPTATIDELTQLIDREYPQIDVTIECEKYSSEVVDNYEMFKSLLVPLQDVNGGKYHPEGDVLYHSLQVFELARREGYGYDLEFLQAALLHDVGKAIDKKHHAEIAAQILEPYVSPRTLFLIRHHMDALKMQKGTLGHRHRQRLVRSEYYDDLMALRRFDNRGREKGMFTDDIRDVITYMRELEITLEDM